MLFNDISESLPVRVESEEQFNQMILSELRVNSNDLQWARKATGDNVDSVDLIYETPRRKDRRMITNKYWAERKGQTIVLEDIEFICYP